MNRIHRLFYHIGKAFTVAALSGIYIIILAVLVSVFVFGLLVVLIAVIRRRAAAAKRGPRKALRTKVGP